MKCTPQFIALSLTLLLLTSCATPGEPFGSPGGVGTEPMDTVPPSTAPNPPTATPTESTQLTEQNIIRIDASTGRPSTIPYESAEITDNLWDLLTILNRTLSFDSYLHMEQEIVKIDYYSILFFPYENKTILAQSLYNQGKRDEYADLFEKYHLVYEDFVETSIADDCFDSIFSKQADSIVRAYKNDERCIEAGAFLGFNATDMSQSRTLILRDLSFNEDVIEMFFSSFVLLDPPSPPILYSSNDLSSEIGVLEDNEYVVTADAFDQLRIVKYTFVLEDGKYKILSIELTKG